MIRRFLSILVVATLPIAAPAAEQTPAETEPLLPRTALQPSVTGLLSFTFDEDVSLQKAFQELARRAGITVLFDESFRDQILAVDLGNVSAVDALEKLTMVNGLFYKILDPKTVLIAPNIAQKHRQYDDLLLHTFYVGHAGVNEMANMFRTIAGIQRVDPNPGQRSLTVRASADQLLVAESILRRNDRPRAELGLSVELLAVNAAPEGAAGLGLSSEEWLRFKSENDAEVLLTQTVRVSEGERADLSIGEGSRQLVAVATPAAEPAGTPTEQTKPEAPPERRSVGIELRLQPQVTVDGNIRLSLTIRATARGVETPGDAEPVALRTRDVTTTSSLKEGETTLVRAMFGPADFGSALDSSRGETQEREVVVAIGASILRAAASSESLPPLLMGTEQRVRVIRP